MKNEKNVWHHFDESAFDEELGFLNAMSEKGWQLADMRAFTQKYVRDDSAMYRYAVDLQHDLSVGEFAQYRAEFEDQGWDYVTRHRSWYVFRRPYDPALPEEAYLLYTDEPSFRDMKRSVGIGLNAFGLMWLPNLIARLSLFTLLPMAVWLLHLVDYIFRRRRLRNVRRIPKPYRFHLWRYSHILILLLLLSCFSFLLYAADTDDFQMEGRTVGVQSETFTLKAPDLITLKLRTTPSNSAADPVCIPAFTLRDERDRLADSGLLDRDAPTAEFLGAGTYTLTIDWDASNAPGEENDNEADYVIRLGYVSLASTQAYIMLLILDFAGLAVVIAVLLKRR